MFRRGVLTVLAALAVTGPALAHHAPPSYVRLDFRARSVVAQVMIPRSELAFSMDGAPTAQALRAYLLRHVGAASMAGAAWRVAVGDVRETDYLGQSYYVAELEFEPPAGGSTREFLLTTDAITHEVRNHVVFVVAEKDYADASSPDGPRLLGALQYPARQLEIRMPAELRPAPGRRPGAAPAR